MTTKFTPHRYFWIVFVAILVACENTMRAPETPTDIAAPTFQTLTPLSTFTPVPFPTVIDSPSLTIQSIPKFPLDGYVTVFQKDGDLYFQDENNSPIRLTHGEKVNWPILSNDNQVVIFNLGDTSENGYSNLYSVNVDGSNMQALVTEQWLVAFGEEASVRYPTFVPDVRQIIFNTYQCETRDYRSPCLIGLYFADMDTGLIKEILPPRNFDQYDHNGNFVISPDGNMVSVAMSDHIDIFSLNGEIIRQNILFHTPTTPSQLFPVQYWLPDSSGLIVAIPDVINFGWAYDYHPTYTVWRYEIEKNEGVQVSLDPPPSMFYFDCGKVISVSPDANWILYDYWDESLQTGAFYVSNLNETHSQEISGVCKRYSAYPWSSDSKHFIYGTPFLGSIEGESISIIDLKAFVGWFDANHFIYLAGDGKTSIGQVGEVNGDAVLNYKVAPFLIIRPK